MLEASAWYQQELVHTLVTKDASSEASLSSDCQAAALSINDDKSNNCRIATSETASTWTFSIVLCVLRPATARLPSARVHSHFVHSRTPAAAMWLCSIGMLGSPLCREILLARSPSRGPCIHSPLTPLCSSPWPSPRTTPTTTRVSFWITG